VIGWAADLGERLSRAIQRNLNPSQSLSKNRVFAPFFHRQNAAGTTDLAMLPIAFF
jgi:hypothetical protein